uniref:Uncharacterized protein n=1 Tax=Aedes aegypti TaxID=7159 RepID=A0A6E8PLD7_AEDAE
MSEVALKPLPQPRLPRQPRPRSQGPQGTGQAEEAVDPPPSQRHGCCCHQNLEGTQRIVPAGHQEVHRRQLQMRCRQACPIPQEGLEEWRREGQVRPNQGHRRFRFVQAEG